MDKTAILQNNPPRFTCFNPHSLQQQPALRTRETLTTITVCVCLWAVGIRKGGYRKDDSHSLNHSYSPLALQINTVPHKTTTTTTDTNHTNSSQIRHASKQVSTNLLTLYSLTSFRPLLKMSCNVTSSPPHLPQPAYPTLATLICPGVLTCCISRRGGVLGTPEGTEILKKGEVG